MARKQHSHEAGYIAERMNPFVPGKKVVIYIAADQGIDVGTKYAVVCDAHSTLAGETSIPKARVAMKRPDNFCDGCRNRLIGCADSLAFYGSRRLGNKDHDL